MCPPAETILAAVERPAAGDVGGATVFRHILRCRECRAAVAFVCAAVASERDRKRQQALWRGFRARISGRLVHWKMVANGESIDAIAASSSAMLVFKSCVADDDAEFWRAKMIFPDIDSPDAPLEINVEGAAGKPIAQGSLVLFGIEIPIANGAGRLTRTQLAEFHQRGGVAFRRRGGRLVPGAPVLNT